MQKIYLADFRFGSKADICSAQVDVRFTLKSGHVRCKEGCPLSANSGHWPGLFWLGLFDHLIGALLHLQRHIEAQSLRGVEVDHQLVLGRRLHWQVTRLLAFESPVQPDSGPPTLLNCAKDSVRYR